MKKFLLHFSRNLFTILILTLLITKTYELKATHAMGGNLTYQNIAPNQYEITLKLYRDSVEEVSVLDQLKLYPNPTNASVFVEIRLGQKRPVKILVMNAM